MRGLSGESVRILKEPDLEAIRPKLVALFEAGYRSLSVIFIHSYTFPGESPSSAPLCLYGADLTSLSTRPRTSRRKARRVDWIRAHLALVSASSVSLFSPLYSLDTSL